MGNVTLVLSIITSSPNLVAHQSMKLFVMESPILVPFRMVISVILMSQFIIGGFMVISMRLVLSGKFRIKHGISSSTHGSASRKRSRWSNLELSIEMLVILFRNTLLLLDTVWSGLTVVMEFTNCFTVLQMFLTTLKTKL